MKLTIATRKSKLALWQANWVAESLRTCDATLDIQLCEVSTTGDQITDRALADIGGKGLFIKGLELELLANHADIAVHSLKDVPAALDSRFSLAAFLPRASAADVLISSRYATLADLPMGAVVGTSSPRRQAQLRHYRPDLQIKALRGNVNTRLDQLAIGQYDAIVLAEAGLVRLGYADRIQQRLMFDVGLPSAGQGIVGVEVLAQRLKTDSTLAQLLSHINDSVSQACGIAEQTMVRTLQGDCHSPIAAHAVVTDDTLMLQGQVLSLDGARELTVMQAGHVADAYAIGRDAALQLLDQGAAALLQARQ